MLFVPHAGWEQVQLGVMIALLLGIGLGVLAGLQGSFYWSIVIALALGVGFGTTVAINGAMLSSASYFTGMSVGQVVDRGAANNSPLFGIAVGVILGMIGGVLDRRGTVIFGTLMGILALISFYFASAPRVQVANVTAALFFLVTINHLILYPLQFVIALMSSLVLRSDPKTARDLWRLSPLHWDEFIWLPLPGTVDLLVTFYQQDAAYGSQAIQWVTLNRFQRRAAQKAIARLGSPPIQP